MRWLEALLLAGVCAATPARAEPQFGKALTPAELAALAPAGMVAAAPDGAGDKSRIVEFVFRKGR